MSVGATEIDALREFVGTHGDIPVPFGYISPAGFPLGRWLATARAKASAGLLGEERAEALDAASGVWRSDLRDQRWAVGLRELDLFIANAGHPSPPAQHRADSGFLLGRWGKEQRAAWNAGTMSEARARQLEVRGFVWTVRDSAATWARHVTELDRYIANEGDSLVHADFVTTSGCHLGNWVRRVRMENRRGLLDEGRVQELDPPPQ